VISPPPSGGANPKNSISIFGRRISMDALLLAGASVAAILVLYRSGQPSAAAQAALPTNLAGDGGTFVSPLPSNALISSAPAPASLDDWAVLRQRNAPGLAAGQSGYDSGPAGGLPLYALGPSGGVAGVSQAAYGSQIELASPGEQAVTLPWGGSSAQFYAVSVGGQTGYYVSAGDVAGIVHGPSGPGSM